MSDFQVQESVVYGDYEQNIKTVMVTTTVMLGSALKSCVQIDWIASTSKLNRASLMVEKLKSNIGRRKQKSYVVTQ